MTTLRVIVASVLVLSPAPQRQIEASCTSSDIWIRCPDALQAKATQDSPAQLWQSDADYWITSLPSDPSRKRLYVVGDQIRLTSADFTNFLRAADDPRADIAEIVVDARAITVDMPIRLLSSTLLLQGETVSFTKRADIALSEPPLDSQGDGIAILAKRLDLRNIRRRPLNFTSYKPDWSFSRHVSVSAAELLVATPTTDAVAFFRDLTKDPIAGITDTRAYSIDVNSAAALRAYQLRLDQEMLWPTAFAGKLTRHFARSPYAAANRQFLLALADEYQVQFNRDRFDYALALISRIRSAIHSEVDLAGRSIYFVPRRDYPSLREYFDRANEESFEVLQLWLTVIDSTLTGQPSAQRADLRSQVRASIDSGAATIAALSRELDSLEQQLAVVNQDLAGLQVYLGNEVARLNRCMEEQQASQERRAQLGAAMSLVSLAGTAAAAAFCPAAAPYVAGAVSLTQAFVEQGTISNPADIIEVATKAQAASQRYQQQAAAIVAGAKALTEAIESGNYDGLDKKLSPVSEKLKALTDWIKTVQSPTVDPAAVAEAVAEGCDTSTVNAVKLQFAEAQNRHSELLSQQLLVSQRVAQLAADQDVGYRKLLELDRESVSNDRDRVALQTMALTVWDEVFAGLSTVAPDLLRAYAYYSGDAVDIDVPLAQLSGTYLDRHNASRELRAALKSGEDAIDHGALLEATRERYRLFKTQILALRGREQSVQARLFGGSTVHRDYRSTDDGDADSEIPRFVARVNDEIARQVDEIWEGNSSPRPGWLDLTPTLVPTRSVTGRWSQLDYAQVSEISVRNRRSLESYRLEFSIVHPAFGNVCSRSQCFFVDFTDQNAEFNRISFVSSVDRFGRLEAATRSGGDYARPPLSSQYYFVVSVEPRGSLDQQPQNREPPRLESLAISLWSVERR